MGGAQPLAVSMCGGVSLNVEMQPDRIQRRLETKYLDVCAKNLDEALKLAENAMKEKKGLSIGLEGNVIDVLQALLKKNTKVTEKRAEIKTSDYYLQLNYEIIKLTNICSLLQTGVDNYDRIYSSLSRHLTAMQSDFDKNNRNEGKPNKANYAQPSLKGNNSNSGNMGRRINSQ
jgi:urocanate hydratase